MSSVVVDAVEHLVRGIVDNPDDVRVDMVTNRRGRTVEVHPRAQMVEPIVAGVTAGLSAPGVQCGSGSS